MNSVPAANAFRNARRFELRIDESRLPFRTPQRAVQSVSMFSISRSSVSAVAWVIR